MAEKNPPGGETTGPRSAIFRGHIVHHRRRPKIHRLRYRVFSLLVDLDELPQLGSDLRLLRYNRFGLFSVHDADHGKGKTEALKDWVEEHLRAAGLFEPGMRIAMLCYPRIFGYVFNPLTVYFCTGRDGQTKAVLYEVCNTFHERHTYVIPATENADGTLRHSCAKQMYVSPFMPMDCRYHFRIRPPQDTVSIAIDEDDAEGPLLYAAFSGKRQTLTDSALLKALFSYPLMTAKIMGAIHWEALKLWWKGVPIHRHRKADHPVASTVVEAEADNAPRLRKVV